MTLTCTFVGMPPDPPRKCNERGVEYCTDCLKEGKLGLADDCPVDLGTAQPVHDCPDCSCSLGHEEGFVACGEAHKAAQLKEATA